MRAYIFGQLEFDADATLTAEQAAMITPAMKSQIRSVAQGIGKALFPARRKTPHQGGRQTLRAPPVQARGTRLTSRLSARNRLRTRDGPGYPAAMKGCEMLVRGKAAGLVSAVGFAVTIGCAEKKEPPKKPPIQTRETLGKTTQNVLEIATALAAGGVPASMEITSAGLDVYSDAYRTSVGRIGTLAVDQKLRLYEAEFGKKPDDYAEFMAAIIGKGRPDGIHLPMLPYYQEWAYDPETKRLVVIEFPAKKEQRNQETTGAAGL